MTTNDDFDHRDQRTIEMLERHLPRVTPPDDLFDRILGEVRAEATVVPLRSTRERRMRRWLPAGAVAVAAAAALAVGISLADRDGLGQPDAGAAITSDADPNVSGQAELYADDNRLRVALTSVPAAPSGHHYEVWVLPEGSQAMVSVGTFDPATTENVNLELSLPGSGPFAAVDVSVEEDDGPPQHSDTSYGTGYFS